MMRLNRGLLSVMLIATLLMSACEGGPRWLGGERLPEGGVAIIRQVSGDDPGLRAPMVRLINSRADFEVIGAQSASIEGVDFNRQSVIVFALGTKPTSGHWARVVGVQQKGGDVFVQGVANRPGIGELTAQVQTQPYALAVLPKVRGTLRAEIDSVEGQAPPQR